MSRSAKKGPYVDEKLFKKVSKLNENRAKQPIKTWARACTITRSSSGTRSKCTTGTSS
jgi:small subunit ribosomal protein S19